MITRIQEVGDTITSDQLRTVIAEIQEDGGEGRGEMAKDESCDKSESSDENESSDTSSKSNDSEGEQEVNRVIRDQVWPRTSATARKRNVRYIAAEGAKNEDKSESGDKSESNDKNENSDTEGKQENNQVIWDHVWPGTREKARKRNIRHTAVEGGMYEAKGAGRSGKYEGEGAGRCCRSRATSRRSKAVFWLILANHG